MEETYEVPALAEVGDFAELTLAHGIGEIDWMGEWPWARS